VRRSLLLVWALGVAAGCASVSKDQADTERLMWDAAQECRLRYPTIQSVNQIDVYGRLHYTYHGSGHENAAFLRCYQDGINDKLRAAASIPAERVVLDADAPGRIVVNGATNRGTVVVPVRINGATDSRLLVDTGSSLTLLSTKLASQLELPINVNTRRSILILAGGREVAVPRVRLASVKLATAAVENLYIGVYDVLPASPEIHGVLGMDFLRHFNVSIDHGRRRLVLTPLTQEREQPSEIRQRP
jgi:predicted aspartyl protease